jgi:transcription antitermination factor NusG
MESWYALQVSTRYEPMVAFRLRELEITEYVPIHVRDKPRPARSREDKPLFPGYVFCRLDLHLGPKLYTIPGVRRIVGYGPRPIPIPDAEIEAIKKLTSARLPIQTTALLVAGDQVTVTNGPFKGMVGIILTANNMHKFVVQLPLLNRSVAVVLPNESLVGHPRQDYRQQTECSGCVQLAKAS